MTLQCNTVLYRSAMLKLSHIVCVSLAGGPALSPSMPAFPSISGPPQFGLKEVSAASSQRQIQAEALLGRGGQSLQFALYSELRSGMHWHFNLLCMCCNAHGQPVRVGFPAAFIALVMDSCHWQACGMLICPSKSVKEVER